MNLNRAQLHSDLCRFYSIAHTGWGGWLDEFREFADGQLSKGVFLELFRVALYDPQDAFTKEHIAKTLQSDFQVGLPTPSQINGFLIEHLMRTAATHPERSIELGQRLRTHFDDFFRDDRYRINEYMTTFYQWWAGDSEWRIGEEYERTKQQAMTDLQRAAATWLNNNTPILNHF